MCKYLLSINKEIKNQIIFEIGSGIGLLGITLLAMNKVQNYIFTDKDDKIHHEIIAHNAKLNNISNVSYIPLNWLDFELNE